MKRLKQAWRALCGEYLFSPKKIYVGIHPGRPERWVQLLNYQDKIIALTGEGDLWVIEPGHDGNFVYQFLMKGPERF